MINKIQPYNVRNNYNPSFKSVITKGARIPIKRRGEVIPENMGRKFLSNLKEMFFELFPKLDPEYRKLGC